MKLPINILIVLFTFILASCSSIFNGPYKTVYVSAVQDSVSVSYYGQTYECPAEIEIPRSRSYDSIIVYNNSRSDTILIRSVVSPAFLYNYMSYGIGYLIDLTNKRKYSYDNNVYIDYSKPEISSTWRNPRSGTNFINFQVGLLNINNSRLLTAFNPTFEIQHFTKPSAGIYGRFSGNFAGIESRFSNSLEFGFHTTLQSQFNIKIGAYMYSEHPSINSSIGGRSSINFAGVNISTRRYLYKGFYSFLNGNYARSAYSDRTLWGFEFGYGISLNKDFMSTQKK